MVLMSTPERSKWTAQVCLLCRYRHSRHSTVVYLLKSGVDVVTVRQWLGHASINTTNRYATIDLEMKREAIAKAEPPYEHPQIPGAWRNDASILTWLESL